MENTTKKPIYSMWYRAACATCVLASGVVAIPEHTLRMAGRGFMAAAEFVSGADPTGGFLIMFEVAMESPVILGLMLGGMVVGTIGGAAAGFVTGAATTVMAVPESIYQLVRSDEPQKRGVIHRTVLASRYDY